MASAPFYDRVLETTTTTGTGTLTLAGAVTGYQSFAAIGNGNTTPMAVWEVDANGNPSGAWEVATVCTYTAAGTTLTRGTFQASSTGSAINFAAGTKRVAQVLPAACLNLLTFDTANRILGVPTQLTTVASDMVAFLAGQGYIRNFAPEFAVAQSGIGTTGPIYYLIQLNGSYAAPTKTLATHGLGTIRFVGYTGAAAIEGPSINATALTDLDAGTPAFKLWIVGKSTADTVVVGSQFSTPELTITNALLELAALLKTTNRAAPASPASGILSVWSDSTDLRLHDKNSAGAIGTTVVADTGASNNFLTAISAAGVVSKAQPAFSNLSGTATIAQLLDGAALKTYITGLLVTRNSTTAIDISAGYAYDPSSGKVLTYAGTTALSGGTLGASQWNQVYLYDNAGTPTIEIVNNADPPSTAYQGTARQGGTNSNRRWIGSFKTNGSSQIITQTVLESGANAIKVWWSTIGVGTAPTRILSAGTAGTYTSVSAVGCVPRYVASTAQIVKQLDATTSATNVQLELSIDGTNRLEYYRLPSSASGVFPGVTSWTTLEPSTPQVYYQVAGGGTPKAYLDVAGYEAAR